MAVRGTEILGRPRAASAPGASADGVGASWLAFVGLLIMLAIHVQGLDEFDYKGFEKIAPVIMEVGEDYGAVLEIKGDARSRAAFLGLAIRHAASGAPSRVVVPADIAALTGDPEEAVPLREPLLALLTAGSVVREPYYPILTAAEIARLSRTLGAEEMAGDIVVFGGPGETDDVTVYASRDRETLLVVPSAFDPRAGTE